jgi:hypothetical protein
MADRDPALERGAEWLDRKLLPILGPPVLGPYDTAIESPEELSRHACPICGHPMNEHNAELNPENGHVYLHHPDDGYPEPMETGRGS